MESTELAEKLTERGYEVKSIRCFSKSFHVNVWTNTSKLRCFYKRPLSEQTWQDLRNDFPPLEN